MVITKVVEWAPRVLAKGVAIAPSGLTCSLIEQLFRRLFASDSKAGAFAFLEGRWAGIEITDLGLQFAVSSQNQLLLVRPKAKPLDVKMRVTWPVLLQLATQQVDPDTLFFRRKLLVTGDTELGLQLKNLLDTIEIKERMPVFAYQQLELLAEKSLT
ncbi:ubiquinone anaerobic biosynthesis accessory factor UbiT [Pseudidiomarina homiensis]|uniref:ubiquinone anaerobic biosynthesis accessory factor UbiT n=1 Tax=Pseudidiomarina homiensis TaxID=364198 RepID=UPI00215A28BF|nr:SCP2 sterol-binding domain-containing protein [Pseudidiomarina homiensis]